MGARSPKFAGATGRDQMAWWRTVSQKWFVWRVSSKLIFQAAGRPFPCTSGCPAAAGITLAGPGFACRVESQVLSWGHFAQRRALSLSTVATNGVMPISAHNVLVHVPEGTDVTGEPWPGGFHEHERNPIADC